MGTLLLLLLGLAVLTAGAEALVRGSSRLAASLGMSPLFIGLTLVAYGTSSPELVVSALAAIRGLPDVAVGNVVGSNIFNTGVVLGMAAIVAPLPCRDVLVRRDVPLVIAVTALLAASAIDGVLARPEAAVFLVLLVAYTGWSYRQASAPRIERETAAATNVGTAPGAPSGALNVLLALAGLGLLVLGAHWLVRAAVELGERLGLSDGVIGLTIVAAGTSLPELATSVVAALRREPEIAVGNVIGSNLFNVLGILGIAGLAAPLSIAPEMLRFDIPIAFLFAVACLPIMASAQRVSRGEGAALIAAYAAYVAWLLAR